MKFYKPDSGQNIVYLDYSGSATGSSVFQTSAAPISKTNLMLDRFIITQIIYPIEQIEINQELVDFLPEEEDTDRR